MEMETSWKKKGTKLWLTLYRRSHQFHVKNQTERVYHDDHCEYEHGKMLTSSVWMESLNVPMDQNV